MAKYRKYLEFLAMLLLAVAIIWWFGRRLGLRGGAGADLAEGGGPFGAFGMSVTPYPRLNIVGAVTRGADSTRNRWGFGLRLTF